MPTSKPSQRPKSMCFQFLYKPYLQRTSSAWSVLRGVTTTRGPGTGLAGASSMTQFPTEAASMETSAGICKVATQILGPVEEELLSIGGKQTISTFRGGHDGGSFLSSSGNVSFTVSQEVTCFTASKTQMLWSFLWCSWMVILKGLLCRGCREKGLGCWLDWWTSRNDG